MSATRQIIYWSISLVTLGFLLFVLRGIMLPFVAGMAVAYFLDPATDKLERWLPRAGATIVVLFVFFLLVTIALLLLVPIINRQVFGLVELLPKYIEVLRESVLPLVRDTLGRLGVESGEAEVRDAMGGFAGDIVGFGVDLFKRLLAGGLAVINLLTLLFITPIVAFYLLRDWDLMIARLDRWLPRQHAPTIRRLLSEVDDVLGGFVRGQGTVCLILGAFYAVSLSLVGLEFGLLIGIIAGLISFVPFVGALVGLALSMTQAIMQFWPEYGLIAATAAIFLAGQVLEGNILTPRLLGDRVGLHPVWVMFGLLAGGALFGFVGVLLAVPATAAAGVLVRFSHERYLQSRLYLGAESDEPPAPAPAREPEPEPPE